MTLALALVGPYAPSTGLDRSLSEETREVTRRILPDINNETSITLGESKRVLVSSLQEAYFEAKAPGWDGYKGLSAEPGAYVYALAFLNSLPTTIPLPEIAVDTDGDIAVGWDLGPRQIFSVRIGRDGTLHYAGLFGHATSHGTEFLREGIPTSIWQGIERVLRGTVL